MSRSVGFASGRVSSSSHSSSSSEHQAISGYTTGNRKSVGGWMVLLGWIQTKKLAAMSLRKRSPTQVCQGNFDAKAKKLYYGGQYSAAFRQATVKLSDLLSNDETRSRQGCGAPTIAAKFNKSMLSSSNDCKIKPTALCNAFKSTVRAYCQPNAAAQKRFYPYCEQLWQHSLP
jgi:hypothetical protein